MKLTSIQISFLALALTMAGAAGSSSARAEVVPGKETIVTTNAMPLEESETVQPDSSDHEAVAGEVTNRVTVEKRHGVTYKKGHVSPSGSGSGSRHDRTRVFNSLTVEEGETVNDAVVVGGKARINGKVTGDMVVVLGELEVGPKAELNRGYVVVLGKVDIKPGAKVSGDTFALGPGGDIWLPPMLTQWPREWVQSGIMWARPMPHQYIWAWVLAGLVIGVYVLLSLMFPKALQNSVKELGDHPGRSFFMGLLGLFLAGPLMLIVMFTLVGILIVPFLVCGFLALFLFGKMTVYSYAGAQVGGQFGMDLLRRPAFALILGALLFLLVYAVPVVGLIAWCVVVPLGLGAVLLSLASGFRSEFRKTATIAVPPGPGVPPIPEAEATLTLPRVGFWARFGATLLDVVMVGFIVAVLNLQPAGFFLMWTAYHIGFWTWKGTTIGGMVFNLRLIRTDGRRMDFATSAVRALAAYLSAFVLFLGFFWAGWSAERQSWHDKIAGTYIVRMPRGISML